MKKAIRCYYTTFKNLRIAQQVQLHKENVEQIEPYVQEVQGLGRAFERYKADAEALGAEHYERAKSEETDLMAGKNRRRSATVKIYLKIVDYHHRNPQNKVEAEAIYFVKFVADAYRMAPKTDYKAETAAIHSLIRDTRKLAQWVELFKLEPLLNRLERENNGFEELNLVRDTALERKRVRGTLKKIAARTNRSFDVIALIINGLHLTQELGAPAKAALEKIIDILKGQIHVYTVIYHRQAGIRASKKKHSNSAGSPETNAPGPSEPDAPPTAQERV
ncbi:hypothetical protein FACS189435_1270 [Bacteroidia bacterium]|nr:hypothetical protein FACS189435_1270 [Bacteroidia bacterium]